MDRPHAKTGKIPYRLCREGGGLLAALGQQPRDGVLMLLRCVNIKNRSVFGLLQSVKPFALVAFIAMLLLEAPILIAQTSDLTQNPVAPSFRSFFDYSIKVTNAVFEKELFLSNIPSQARNQVFFIKLDGENYLLGTLKDIDSTQYDAIGGCFGSSVWEVSPNYLTVYDQMRNGPTSSIPVVASESVMRMTANLFLNLGITEITRGSLVWVENKNRITGTSTSGKNIIVDFEGNVDAPTRASIKDENGEEYAYVRYSYSSDFCNSKIPHEFSRFHTGAPSEDVGKIFTVRIRQFHLTPSHIPLADLDPQKLFHFDRVVFYSNNVMYWSGNGQSGGPQHVLTAEEAAKSIPHTAVRPGITKAVRIIVVAFLVCSSIGMLALLVTQNKQKIHHENK
jgi:hypothetical protein